MMQDRESELIHARDHLQMHGGLNSLAMENKRLRARVAELEEELARVGAADGNAGEDAGGGDVHGVPQPEDGRTYWDVPIPFEVQGAPEGAAG